jgi:SAM-dependent methyltransferase
VITTQGATVPPTQTAELTPDALDDYARQYYLSGAVDDVRIEEHQQTLVYERLAASLNGCGRVLEMGYGTGVSAHVLTRAGVPVEIVEGSPLLVEAARAAHPGLVLHESMFETFEPGPVFDAVLAMYIAEHVDDPSALLRTVARWLRPGGRLIIAVPNAGSLHRRLAVRMGLQERLDSLSPRDHLLGHQRVYTLQSLRADVEQAGFAVREEMGWFLKALPNAMMLDYSEELLEGLHHVSDELPAELMANIAIVAEAPGA